jgi:hypothetical protein
VKVCIDDLIALVEDIRNKIENYGQDFTKSEAFVRYSLIDPFLNALGWDTTDPSMVRPEFSTPVGRPDYALIDSNNKPIAFIGAKGLNKDENLRQYITYCVEEGVPYFIASDGSKWEVYHTFKQSKTPDKKIIEWNVVFDEPNEVVMKALSIARPLNFRAKAVNSVFQNNVKSVPEEKPAKGEEAVKSHRPGLIGTERSKRRTPTRPLRLEIDGVEYQAEYARDVLIKTAEWLERQGKLSLRDCPVSSGRKRFIVNVEPKHNNGKAFIGPHKLKNGVWIELHNSSQHTEKLARDLLTHFGFPKNTLKVKWSRNLW